DILAGDQNDFVTVSAATRSNIFGSTGNDILTGGSVNDTLHGDNDNDILVGGLGADTLNGNAGTDTADYSARTNPVTVTLDGAANDGESGEGDLVSVDVENVTGGSGADTLTGNSS